MKKSILIILLSLLSSHAFATETISFNVKGFWYMGRMPQKKIAYIGDVNTRTGNFATIEDIQIDVDRNGCRSVYVQESVEAMLRVFGPSRKISIEQIEIVDGPVLDFESQPCLYSWRGGRTGRVCYEDICVSAN